MAVIVLATIGSWGDLFPFIGLGRALADRGHDVRLAASPAWAEIVADAGLAFEGIGPSVGFDDFRAHPEIFQRVPFGLRHALSRFVFDEIDAHTRDLRRAMAGADLVVVHPAQVAAHDVAESLGVRRVVATVFPGMLPSAHTVPGGTPYGPWSGPLGRAANRLAWSNARLVLAALFDRPINRHRRSLDLSPLRGALVSLTLRADAVVVLASPHVVPRPPDWPPRVVVASFVTWDRSATHPLDPATAAFLDDGPPPILVTLGSSSAVAPDDFFEHAAGTVTALGLRALVVTGPASTPGLESGPDVRVVDHAPFAAVLPRCRAAVHHGGVGTSVAALVAGVPQVVVPKGFDQPDTAARLESLGVGVSVPWRARHRRLASAVRRIIDEPGYGARAAALGLRVAGEDGAALAADVVERHLPGQPTSTATTNAG